jgi:hypothetical protein
MSSGSSKTSSVEKAKQKSKSLQFQSKQANSGSVELSDSQAENISATLSAAEKSKKELEIRKRSATANFCGTKTSTEEQRARSATFSNKKATLQSSAKKSSILGYGSNLSGTNFKHQIAYKKSLTLNLFEHKWQILHDRSGVSSLVSGRHWPKSLLDLKQLLKESSVAKGSSGMSGHHQETLRSLVHTFWTAICLLESDYEHEFIIAIEIIEQILSKCDLNAGSAHHGLLVHHKNELRTSLEMFAFRINWPSYPGLQNLLLKGCVASQSTTVEATHRLLVQLVPYCAKLNFIDPVDNALPSPRYCGLSGLALNLLAILPTMIQNYDKPAEVCVAAAEAHCKALRDQIRILEEQQQRMAPLKQHQQQAASSHVIIHKSNKIEHLRNLVHILNMYAQRSFGKDRQQWTKCVITYLSEFFQQCDLEQHQSSSKEAYYFMWVVFLTELLERSAVINPAQQTCVLGCLQALLTHIDFGDAQFWSFINDDLMRHVCKCLNTQPSLFADALELVKLVVSKSSSLTNITNNNRTAQTTQPVSNSPKSSGITTTAATPITMHNFFNRKELPGRTLEFDFDFGIFTATSTNYDEPNLLRKTNSSSNTQAAVSSNSIQPPPMLNLLSLHVGEQLTMLNQYTNSGHHLMYHNLHGGWKRPALSKPRTRERFYSLLNTFSKHSTPTLSSNNASNLLMPFSGAHTVHKNIILEEPQQPGIDVSSSIPNKNGLIDEQDPLSSTLNQSTTSTSSSSGMMSPPQALRPLETTDLSTSKHSSLTNTTSSSSLAVSPNPTATAQKAQDKSVTTTSSSSSSLSYNNRTSASNSSLNKTSFVTSPEATPTVGANTFKEKSPSPTIAPKPSGSMINNLIASFNQYSSNNSNTSYNHSNGEKKFEFPHHTRKNSMSIIKGGAIVGGGPSIVSIVNTGSSGNISSLNHGNNPTQPVIHQPIVLSGQHKSTASISSMKLLQQGGSVEIDNNFINNTFSFLDDLDQDGDTPMSMFSNTNSAVNTQSETVNQRSSNNANGNNGQIVNSNTAVINVNSSNVNEDNSDSNNEISAMNENANNDYENFPWHAIYPATDSNSATDSSSQLNLSKFFIFKLYLQIIFRSLKKFIDSILDQKGGIRSKTK